jgi:hypothetical protein
VGDVESGAKPHEFEITQAEFDQIDCIFEYGKAQAAMKAGLTKRLSIALDQLNKEEDDSSSSDSDCDENHHDERYGQFD